MTPDLDLPTLDELVTRLPAHALPIAVGVLFSVALALLQMERRRGRQGERAAWGSRLRRGPQERPEQVRDPELAAAAVEPGGSSRGSKPDLADTLTMVAAGIATAVAAQGMWRVASDVLHLPIALRIPVFAFLEVSVIASAVRARRSMRDHGMAGPDGIAVWVFTGLSAVLSSLDSRSMPEHVARLSAPLVAAWLWERGMAVEHRRRFGQAGRINWRISPERILIRLGLADPTDRTASDVDAQRRLIRLALAASHARGLTGRRRTWALSRLDRAMRGAVAHAGLAVDVSRQHEMLAHLGVLVHAQQLVELQPRSPWADQLGDGLAPRESTSGLSSETGSGSASASSSGPTGIPVATANDEISPDDETPPLGSPADLSSGGHPALTAPTGRSGRRPIRRPGRRANLTTTDSPVPQREAWDWYCAERAVGRKPSEGDFVARFALARSTGGRWRRACDSAYTKALAAGTLARKGQDKEPELSDTPVGSALLQQDEDRTDSPTDAARRPRQPAGSVA